MESIKKIIETSKEDITLSLIEDLPLEFLSKMEAKLLKFRIQGSKKEIEINYQDEKKRLILDLPPYMYLNLYNFQKDGIQFGIKKNCRFLLADEMGVGKTIQAIGLISIYRNEWPVLIICPSSLKYNWKDEILAWLKDLGLQRSIQIIKKSSDDFEDKKEFFIISYDLCVRMEKKLQAKEFNFIIADEAHYLKNMEAKRTKILLPLMQKSKRLILISGTPIVAKPSESFSLLKSLRPDIFKSFTQFAHRYCNPRSGPFGMDYSGSSNVKELNFFLKFLMIRRLKVDVLSELPPKKRQKVTINTDDAILKQIKVLLNKKAKPPQIIQEELESENSTFMKAYALTGDAKLKGIFEYISYLVESKKLTQLLSIL